MCETVAATSLARRSHRLTPHDVAVSLGKYHAHFVLHAEQRTKDICVEGPGVVSAVCSVSGPGVPSVPVQFTAASRRPKRETVLSIRLRMSSSWRTASAPGHPQ